MLLFNQYPWGTLAVTVAPMNTASVTPASIIQATPKRVRGIPASSTGNGFTVVFKLGLDLSTLCQRQHPAARTLLQRLTGKTSHASAVPQS